MKITSARTGTVVLLVDPATGSAFSPIPAVNQQQVFDQYHPEGGPARQVPHGSMVGAITPTALIIEQLTDATARAVLHQLRVLQADITEQPFVVEWTPGSPGPDDGLWWWDSIATPEVESDYDGRIHLQVAMTEADPDDVGPSAVTVRHNGVAVGTLSALRVTIG